MEIRHLQHFIALAEEGKFTAAAQRMHIVQSGLSVSIKELEQELGTQLVRRTTRSVSLTPNGELFQEYARNCLATLKDGVVAVRSQDGVVRGRLHLGILQSLTPYVALGSLLERFRTAYPEVEFAVRSLQTESIPAQVRSGYVDLSFQAVVGEERWPGLEVSPFVQDSLIAVCSETHELAAKKSVKIETLAQHSLVELTSERALRKLADRIFSQYHLQRSTACEVSDIDTLLHFVSQGLGVAIVPSALARSRSVQDRLHTLKIVSQTFILPKWKVVILTRPRRKDLPGKTTVELFLEMLAGSTR